MVVGRAPKAAKGARRNVEVSAAMWIDLLGFGDMLRGASWDPTSSTAELAVERLTLFQSVLTSRPSKYFPILMISDGAVAFRDLSPRTASVTADFINRAVATYRKISRRELERGWPGPRAVIAAGFRMRTPAVEKPEMIAGIGRALVERASDGRLPIRQAVLTALTVRPYTQGVPELQANFAFSKAYLVDAGGKSKGFPGPNLYIDKAFLREDSALLKDYPNADWNSDGMVGSFMKVPPDDEGLTLRDEDCQDSFEVAEVLAGGADVLGRLHRLRGSR